MADRKIIPEVVIMMAVAVGASVLFVQPKMKELHDLESLIAEARRNPITDRRAQIEHMANRMRDIRLLAGRVTRQNELGDDSSKMYGLITGLAKTHGVVVGRLDPGEMREILDGETPLYRTTSFDVTVEGTYEAIAAFLEGVQSLEGFVRPRNLMLSPRSRESYGTLTAQFSCEAISFPLPPVLRVMVGGADADE